MSEHCSAWTLLEELNLLNAVEIYSFGNWKDIAQLIGTRNAEESKEHYVKRFVEGSIGTVTWLSSNCRPVLCNLMDTDNDVLTHRNVLTMLPNDIQPKEANQLHYHPLRDDFEIEYDSEAETLVSSLALSRHDTDLDVALKLAHVDMYTERLRERERRHRILRDYKLISKFFRRAEKARKNISKDEKLLQIKCLPFAQFFTGNEYEQFIDNLINQQKLSHRLAKLSQYRQYGVTSFQDLIEFEKQSLSRNKVYIELLSLVKRKRKKTHKKLQFYDKNMCLGKQPFLRFGA